ncbi:MAG: TIGR03960 family B12-binding radical SAM protein [Bdellovibrionota bacterium]
MEALPKVEPSVAPPPLKVLSDQDLLCVQKPAQYLGGEKNSVHKAEAEVDVRFALCFPDTYEVGMSHLGLQILYDILNREEKTWAERVYMPMADMEELLRARELPLCSLEAQRPLHQFDVVGFSLQYELCGTNILAMLDLGRVSMFAADRSDGEPLVLAGGPYAYHPEALAPFFDAFFLGDAEEAILEVTAIIRSAKARGIRSRKALLQEISGVEGVYVPSQFSPELDADGKLLRVRPEDPAKTSVTRRLMLSMSGAPYPKKPVVPNIQTVHNRLSIEVMRGCVRGCRFCQAGYLYRPQRERSPQEIVEMIGDTLPETGFEELSLLSLSTADYCSIVPLLKTLMDRYAGDDKLSISFPSTRVDALTPEVLEQVQRVRRTGFTVAPEGGSQRLRDVINKGVTDDQIIETCSNVFRMGWNGIKLYFMLGLPTETDEDLQGIIDVARRVRSLEVARGKEITVSVSTFVPKPHTPFQWAAQITPGETIRRQRLLAEGLRLAKVNFRYHDSFSSFLEGVFCRAGREFAPVLVRAYELGCRLDAWQDHLKEDLWMQAFAECGVDPETYLRERAITEALPWDHLSCGIPKSYFLKEWQRALRDKPTGDCLTSSCSSCNACDYDEKRNILWPRAETEALFGERKRAQDESPAPSPQPKMRIRLRYEKMDRARYIGHLELVSMFHRAARRAEIPLAFTQGFHPLPKLAFGPPLQLGVGSRAEYVDMYLIAEMSQRECMERLNGALPPGIQVQNAIRLPLHGTSIHESIVEHRYEITWATEPRGVVGRLISEQRSGPSLGEALTEALAELTVVREKPNTGRRGRKGDQTKTFSLADYVRDIRCEGTGSVSFSLTADNTRACPKPSEIVMALSELEIGGYYLEKLDAKFKDATAELPLTSVGGSIHAQPPIELR